MATSGHAAAWIAVRGVGEATGHHGALSRLGFGGPVTASTGATAARPPASPAWAPAVGVDFRHPLEMTWPASVEPAYPDCPFPGGGPWVSPRPRPGCPGRLGSRCPVRAVNGRWAGPWGAAGFCWSCPWRGQLSCESLGSRWRNSSITWKMQTIHDSHAIISVYRRGKAII